MGACVVDDYVCQLKPFSVRRRGVNCVDVDVGNTYGVSGEAFQEYMCI